MASLAGVSSASAGTFLLTQEGRPAATIVLAAAPSENARVAAAELQGYVRRMSSAELPIVTDAQAAGGRLVLVGASRLTEQVPGLEIPSGLTRQLGEEGFVVQCRGDRLVLAGNDAGPYFGTRYAVVELLQVAHKLDLLRAGYGVDVHKRHNADRFRDDGEWTLHGRAHEAPRD